MCNKSLYILHLDLPVNILLHLLTPPCVKYNISIHTYIHDYVCIIEFLLLFCWTFESKVKTLWAFIPEHFSLYFLKTRTFSYIIAIQLSNPGNLTLKQCCYLIYSLYLSVAICPLLRLWIAFILTVGRRR